MKLLHCRILLKKSGHPTPRVELDEIGPSLDLVIRRTHLASSDLYKQACKVPKATKVSNINDHACDINLEILCKIITKYW